MSSADIANIIAGGNAVSLSDLFPGLDLAADLALDTNKRPIARTVLPRIQSDEAVVVPVSGLNAAASPSGNRKPEEEIEGLAHPNEEVIKNDSGILMSHRVHTLDHNTLLRQIQEHAAMCLFPDRATLGASSPPGAFSRPARMRDIRVFCNFLSAPGKKCSYNVRLNDKAIRGIDVVEASIKVFLLSDEKLRGKYSENPLHYKLYLADEHTGEELGSVKLESSCASFQCLTLEPLPVARLYLYPERAGLLPMVYEDVSLVVEVHADDKTSRHQKTVPADLLVEQLEKTLTGLLMNTEIIRGSLRIRYGPSEIEVSDRFNFGAGCGYQEIAVGERTVLALARFGVTEVTLKASRACAEGDELSPERSTGASASLIKRLDEEEAKAYQQFDVVKINKFGIRQERVIGVDGERVYNMRPSSEAGTTKNPERYIADIEMVRDFRDRPNYCEIEYSKLSKYDTDRIELKSPYDCAMLVEKLRVLKKIHDRRAESRKNSTTITRFLGKLGFGK